MAQVLGESEPEASDVEGKKQLLLAHGVALWDVVASCDVAGSSDASIRNVVPVDVGRVLESATIEVVFCNGGTAGQLYRRWLEPVTGMATEVLPSTSPANASWTYERLLDRWQEALGPYIT